MLSYVVPGFGHILKGDFRQGLALYAVTILISVSAIVATRLIPPTPSTIVGVAAILVLASLVRLAFAIYGALLKDLPAAGTGPTQPFVRWGVGLFLLVAQVPLASGLVPPLTYGWFAYAVPSYSNSPGLIPGEYLFIDRRKPGVMPERGDMVMFHMNYRRPVEYVARVVGIAGDRVQLRRGTLYLNGKAVPRRFVEAFPDGSSRRSFRLYNETLPNGRVYGILQQREDGPLNDTPEFLVPPGHVFILGDNRDDSIDSRVMTGNGFLPAVGFVPVSGILGVARTIYWSPDSARILDRVR